VDGSSVYLEPEGAFAEAQRLAAEQGQAIPLSARTLHRRLNERGLLARVEQSGGKTRFCVRAVLEGQRREVLCFSAATLFPPEGAAIAPRPASAAWSGDRSGDTLDGECDSPSQSCATLARPRVRPNGHRENAERDPEMAHSAHCLNGEVSAGAGAE
jgi:hypothetical protein